MVVSGSSAAGPGDLGRAFAAIAARHAMRPAIRALDGRDVDYAELDALSGRLARWLVARGAGPGGVVALQNAKTPEGYAAMLACLKIGAAYANLDPQGPPARLARILSACRPAAVVCDEAPAAAVAMAAQGLGLPVMSIRDHATEIARLPAALPADLRGATGADPAYIMFTSGSTGTPKGAAIAHGSVLNFIAWTQATFAIGPDDVVANANPIYFDNSVFDFYAALFSGACLAPVAVEPGDAAAAVHRVDAARCTVWFSVPSLLIYLMTMKALSAERFASVRTIVFGGEGFPKRELAKLFAMFGARASLFNVYGPTECTCICSAHRVSASDLADLDGLPPLGRIAGLFSYAVLDGDAAVTPGAVGELCLMGPQVGLGYCNDPERTRAAFVPDPLRPGQAERMYRTGDLVRDVDGCLFFVGRKDNQIKHMGYRIELEEIEAAINRLDYVVQSAAVYKRMRETFGHIVAYVATEDTGVDDARLRGDLARLLPSYMLPNRFVISRELPKNANGKVDRARLMTL
jgi:D-alanine--poly(phosphoribitol) ligase subunit 1